MKFACRPKTSARLLFRVAAALFALALTAAPAAAQRNPVERMKIERNEQQMREVQMRRLESHADSRGVPEVQPRLFYDQIREDFRRMQVVNNEMLHATFSGAGAAAPRFDYGLIAKSVSEIGRRAARLRSNLRLPEAEEEKPKAEEARPSIASGEQLKASLLALDNLIMGFVRNPAFHKSDVVDAEHSARAHRELTQIVELSRRIKLGAERMKN